MRIGMVANRMSGGLNSTCDIGPLLYITSDQKKRGFCLMFCQKIKQAQSVGIIGAVIVSKGNLSGIAAVGCAAPGGVRREHPRAVVEPALVRAGRVVG